MSKRTLTYRPCALNGDTGDVVSFPTFDEFKRQTGLEMADFWTVYEQLQDGRDMALVDLPTEADCERYIAESSPDR